MTENEKDIALLHSDPTALVLKYQETIRFIAEQYVRSGMFSPGDTEDVIQSINEGLLQRIPAIAAHYNKTATLITYLSAIIRNICLQLRERHRVQFQPLGMADPEDSAGDRLFERLAINSAVGALQEVFQLFHRDKGRLIILLRLYFKLPLDETAIREAFPRLSRRKIPAILKALGRNTGLKTERELFTLAASFLNGIEKRNTSGDGYRHWLGERIPEVINLLEVRLRVPNLGTDGLRTLVEAMTLQSGDRI